MTRILSLRLAAAVLTVAAVHGSFDVPPYTQVARVDRSVDGKGFNSFAFDPLTQRLYAGSWNGVFWVDLREREPRIKGPILNKRIGTIEIAPESGRLFYTSIDEFGYVNLRSNDPPRVLAGRESQIGRMAYEPTRREMYVGTREQGILVFDTETGERAPVITLPGWYPTTLEAAAGKVFVSLKDKSGLYVIDAATHTLAPWPVKGKLVTPAYLEADPTGQYLFAAYYKNLVAIDIASATIVGRLTNGERFDIAYDPERRLLIAADYELPDHPRLRLRAFSISGAGFTQVAELKNPPDGSNGLESFRGGFLQYGYSSLLLWSAAPIQSAGAGGTKRLE